MGAAWDLEVGSQGPPKPAYDADRLYENGTEVPGQYALLALFWGAIFATGRTRTRTRTSKLE